MKKLRLGQHGSLLVALTSAQGLLATYAHAITTNETISTAVSTSREISFTFDNLDITNQGSLIASGFSAIQVTYDGNLNYLNNAGTISGTSGYSVYNAGTIGTIANSGTIANASTYGAIYLENGSQTDLISNSGLIGDTSSSNYGYAIHNYGYINTLNNKADGTIIGAMGLYNNGYIYQVENAGIISNNNNGHSGDSAIFNEGSIDTIVNTGTISSNYSNGLVGGSVAIRNYGNIGTLNNSGTISSNYFGILSDSTQYNAIGEIINSGLIKAPQAIYTYNNNSFSDAIKITNSGTIAGNIYNYGATPIVISGGKDGQGVLTGYNPGATGYIFTNGGNVTFSSGSLLLNNHVYASGGTVLNDAARLQVNAPLIIYGNYHQNATGSLILGVSDGANASEDTTTASGYGRLTVNGAATIDQGSHISLARTGNTYSFATGQRYVVISANSADTQYNASSLNYKAEGYNGAVKGTEVNDGTRSALVLSLEEAPVIVTPPQTSKPTPVTPEPVTAPVTTTPATPVVTTPVTTEPTTTAPATPAVETPVVVTPVEATPVVATPVAVAPIIVTPIAVTPAQPQAEPVKPVLKNRATTEGATSTLTGLTQYSGISPQLLELYNASLAINGTSEANRVGEQLSSSQNINASTATSTAVTKAMSVVGNHMNTARNPQTAGMSGVSTGDAYDEWAFWGQPFGGFARQDSSREVSGYKAKFGGLLLGADRALGDNWRAGAAVNYSNTSVHGTGNLNNDRSTADNYGVIGYAGYTGNPWYLNLSAGVNRQNYASTRHADFTGFSGRANGKFNGQSVTLQTELGYPLQLPADVVLTPMATLTYGYQHIDGYKESGGNGMALNVGSSHNQSVTSDIGVRVEKTFDTRLGKLTPFVQASWIHQYDDRQMSSTATFGADTLGETQFTTKGAAPVKDMAGIAIGSTLYNAKDLTLDARYDLQAGERYQAHTFSLRLRKTF
jgi:outer membrane autotransporter protein